MTLPYHARDEERPEVPEVPEVPEPVPVVEYAQFSTATLLGSLYSLRMAVKVHGPGERTAAIERRIITVLRDRGIDPVVYTPPDDTPQGEEEEGDQ